jgi:hypothetical protein
VYAVAAGGRLPEVVAGLGAAGIAAAALALAAGWPQVLPVGLVGVGAGYSVFLGLHSGAIDTRAPLVAAALFAAAEAGFWSLEPQGAHETRASIVRRLLLIGATALATAFVGALMLVIAAGVAGGIALEAAGVAAAVLAAALVAVLAARANDSPRG